MFHQIVTCNLMNCVSSDCYLQFDELFHPDMTFGVDSGHEILRMSLSVNSFPARRTPYDVTG